MKSGEAPQQHKRFDRVRKLFSSLGSRRHNRTQQVDTTPTLQQLPTHENLFTSFAVGIESIASPSHPDRNEDHRDVLRLPHAIVLIACDGAGGEGNYAGAGAEASATATQTIKEYIAAHSTNAQNQEEITTMMQQAILTAHENVRALENRGKTTATIEVIQDGRLHWANVGDGRAGIWHNGRLTYLSEDQGRLWHDTKKTQESYQELLGFTEVPDELLNDPQWRRENSEAVAYRDLPSDVLAREIASYLENLQVLPTYQQILDDVNDPKRLRAENPGAYTYFMMRNEVARLIGQTVSLELSDIETGAVSFGENDRAVVLTDGIQDNFTTLKIDRSLARSMTADPEEMARDLINEVGDFMNHEENIWHASDPKARGKKDDATVLVGGFR